MRSLLGGSDYGGPYGYGGPSWLPQGQRQDPFANQGQAPGFVGKLKGLLGDRDLAMALLANSGYSPQKRSFGEILGTSMLQANQAKQGREDAEFDRTYKQAMIDKAQRGSLPNSAEEYEYYSKLNPEQRKLYDSMRARSAPAGVQEFEYFQKLTPEQQQSFMKLQRQPTVPQLATINGVPTLVDRVTGTQTPLTSLQSEIAATTAKSGAEAEASARGKGAGEVQADIQKKGAGADAINSIIDIADPLIDVATGSTGGAAYDKVVGFFGYAPKGAQATAQLQILQASLMMNQPRMEGPQGVLDVQLYEKMAGEIGDPTVPRERKKAALQTIRMLQDKYKERAASQPGQKGADKPKETAAERAKRLGL